MEKERNQTQIISKWMKSSHFYPIPKGMQSETERNPIHISLFFPQSLLKTPIENKHHLPQMAPFLPQITIPSVNEQGDFPSLGSSIDSQKT